MLSRTIGFSAATNVNRVKAAGLTLALVTTAFVSVPLSSSVAAQEPEPLVGKVVYVSDRTGTNELYVRQVDGGSGRKRITFNNVDEYDPHWSPGGGRVVFQRGRDIYIKRIGGGPAKIFRRHSYDPAWSPDGKWIAYAAEGFDGNEVFASRVDGSAGESVGPDWENAESSDPAFSPDSASVAVHNHDDGNIFIQPICCESPTSTVDAELWSLFTRNLEWSPDGTTFLYSVARTTPPGDDPNQNSYGIYSYSIEEDKETLLLHTGARELNGSWSPDGSRIILYSSALGTMDLYVMDADGSNLSVLPHSNEHNELHPDWWGPPTP
jgi:Tol biopolymer transport system component